MTNKFRLVKPLSHQGGVLTAFPQHAKKIAKHRGARCAVASNSVCVIELSLIQMIYWHESFSRKKFLFFIKKSQFSCQRKF